MCVCLLCVSNTSSRSLSGSLMQPLELAFAFSFHRRQVFTQCLQPPSNLHSFSLSFLSVTFSVISASVTGVCVCGELSESHGSRRMGKIKTDKQIWSPWDLRKNKKLSLFIYCIFVFLLLISFRKNNPFSLARSQHTRDVGEMTFSPSQVCCVHKHSPADRKGIGRLSRGIIIYYHIDCWAVKMTQFLM